MYDDEHIPTPYDPDEPDEFDRPSRWRNCFIYGVSLVLILSLLLSSVLTYYVFASRANRANSTADLRGETQFPAGPTAAPATVVAAAAVAATTVAGALSPTPEVDPEPAALAPDVNRIAVLNEDGQVETMSPDGEDRRVLTLASDDTSFQFPAWAPDGRRVAIIGNQRTGGAIYVLEDAARTGTLRDHQIYYSANQPPIYLFWSPTSDDLGFLSNEPRNSLGLNVISGDGTDTGRLLATGAPFYWDWSDDGQQLLIHSGRNSSADALALIDMDGQTQADNLAIPGEFQAPGIGQGGRYWAFAERGSGGLSSLVVVDTQTGERTALDGAGSLALGWSPTQDQIAYTKGAIDGHPYWGPLHVLDVASGEDSLVSTQTVLAFFWSPDGRRIAFITLGNRREDEGINVSAPEKSRQTSRIAGTNAVQFGQGFLTLSVVDVATGRGLRLLDFEPTITYLAQFLPYFDQYALSHRVWSPDSSALVLPVQEEGANTILIIPVEGGRPHRLAEGDIAFWSPN